MKQFVIHLEEDLHILADIGKEFGKQNVDIISTAGISAFGICTAILLTNNEKRAMSILSELDIPFSTQDVLVASLPNKLGAFGHFTQLLFDQGIQVLSFYALGFTVNQAEFAFTVHEADFEKAQSFLDASGFLKPGKNQDTS